MAHAAYGFATTVIGGQVRDDAERATAFAADMTGKWKGNMFNTFWIRWRANIRKVLGSDALRRTQYADSPIVKYITTNCMRTKGRIYVIYASSNIGKTTACHAVLDKYAKKGLATAASDLDGHYRHMFLDRIGLNRKNPPKGWLTKFLKELAAPVGENPAILLLDDFMNENPDDRYDKALLTSMKTEIRGRNICIVVLTKNKKSANKMITWNDMGSIVPALPRDEVAELRRRFLDLSTEEKQMFEIDWDTCLPMVWETDELKKAILADPMHVNKSDNEKDDLIASIDATIAAMNDDSRRKLEPESLLSQLVDIKRVPTLSPRRRHWHEIDWDVMAEGCFCN